MKNLPLHVKTFNERVRVMNQTQSKTLTLTAQEARGVQADILDILNCCAALTMELQRVNETPADSAAMDGGQF